MVAEPMAGHPKRPGLVVNPTLWLTEELRYLARTDVRLWQLSLLLWWCGHARSLSLRRCGPEWGTCVLLLARRVLSGIVQITRYMATFKGCQMTTVRVGCWHG